jgi:hypothetical protein
MAEQGLVCPHPHNPFAWGDPFWRALIPVLYRPLNVSAVELCNNWDVEGSLSDYQPYSAMLESWYQQCFQWNPYLRVTSAQLVEHLVPLIDRHLLIEH